ncbi:MAG TPA: YbaB/EbfC family nucleoid-associated protein [Gammaproteobacteria bacterium]|nr:YbaB/EbfC family nucleoid-associated protein [Gammaproteobacteria bacterium]
MSNSNLPGMMNNQVLEFLKDKGQEMVEHFQKMQEELARKEIYGIGGVEDSDEIFVKVFINGLQECTKVVIGKGATEEGVAVLADLTRAAINSAMEKVKTTMQGEVMKVYEKSGLPLSGENKDED